MSEGASNAAAWGGFLTIVAAVAMGIKAAFSDDKKDQK